MFECPSMLTFQDMKRSIEFPWFRGFYTLNFDGQVKIFGNVLDVATIVLLVPLSYLMNLEISPRAPVVRLIFFFM